MTVQVFSPETIAELGDMLRWYRQTNMGGVTGDTPGPSLMPERQWRWAKTSTTSVCLAYPADNGLAQVRLPVVLGSCAYDDSACGTVSLTFTAYTPVEERVVYSVHGWVPEGSILEMTLHDGRWFACGCETG